MKQYLVKPGEKVNLSKWDPSATGDFEEGKQAGLAEIAKLNKKLEALQELLYAEHKHKGLDRVAGHGYRRKRRGNSACI